MYKGRTLGKAREGSQVHGSTQLVDDGRLEVLRAEVGQVLEPKFNSPPPVLKFVIYPEPRMCLNGHDHSTTFSPFSYSHILAPDTQSQLVSPLSLE